MRLSSVNNEPEHHITNLPFQDPSEQFYINLCQSIVRQIRSDRTQITMSKKLNYPFNQWEKWESGRKHIRWSDFEKILKIDDRDFASLFLNQFVTSYTGKVDTAHCLKILKNRMGFQNEEQVAQYLKSPKTVVRRWFRENSNPPLAKIFQFIDYKPFELTLFIQLLLSGKLPAELEPRWKFEQQIILTCSNEPNMILVNAAISSGLIENSTAGIEKIQQLTSLASEEVVKCLHLLQSLKMVLCMEGRWQSLYPGLSFSRHTSVRPIIKHYSELAMKKFNPMFSSPQGLASKSVITAKVEVMSVKARDEINDLIIDFHRRVSEVIKKHANETQDQVRVIVCQNFKP